MVSFNACRKENDINVWRDANINAYLEVTKNPAFRELKTGTGPTGVYYKVIKSGTGNEYPHQTSAVKVYYKLSYYDGIVFDIGSFQNNIPIDILVNGSMYGSFIPRGFSFALQQMVVGDKWEIWVPYHLGYGYIGLQDPTSYQLLIKGYSTLVYEVELLSIKQYP